jgi:hypothetical protein
MSGGKLLVAALALVAVSIGIGLDWARSDSLVRTSWQQAVVPGALSKSHAFLAQDCVACHAPVKGVEAAQCIACHADNKALLQRQPTAFHADIRSCTGCHLEHQAAARMPATMDHALFAKLGAGESQLDCASCHATKDRHQGLFGADCAQCHATAQWTVAEFRHPSPRATECAQCHKPPPSHIKMHFSMMSAPIARQPDAKVEQCYLCHQTTSWNDIKGAGWVKHH